MKTFNLSLEEVLKESVPTQLAWTAWNQKSDELVSIKLMVQEAANIFAAEGIDLSDEDVQEAGIIMLEDVVVDW